MKRLIATLITVAVLMSVPAMAEEKPKDAKVKKVTRVLLITGRDVPPHPWRETTPELRKHLEASQFEVVVSEEPLVLESSALKNYDVIMLNYYNWQVPTITDKAKANLDKFVSEGKGLVSFHFSCYAFGEWKQWQKMIGRVWIGGTSGHGPRGEFDVKIKDKDHYITQGLSDFKADDELYAKLVGDEPINVLVETYSDWSKKVEPLAWTLDYGKGRVFNIVLGHDARACKNPSFGKLLTRGTRWVARDDKE